VDSKSKFQNDNVRKFPVNKAIQSVQESYNTLKNDEHARFRSWEYCYDFFSKNNVKPDETTIDLLSLHLAWYLASWGMLRGSAFLLQKDYKIHLPVVKLLIAEENRNLYCLNIDDYLNDDILKQIMHLSNKIVDTYRNMTQSEKFKNGRNASDTLVSKILLGTMGCTPAFDRNFKTGLRKSSVSSATFTANSLKRIAIYYKNNFDEFEKLRNEMDVGDKKYPIMKIIDMCFWQLNQT